MYKQLIYITFICEIVAFCFLFFLMGSLKKALEVISIWICHSGVFYDVRYYKNFLF